MKRQRIVYVVETWAEAEPWWEPWFISRHRKVAEKEMRDGRHAFGRHALAGDYKFRLVRYTPAPTEKK